jgi:hypothetical protein
MADIFNEIEEDLRRERVRKVWDKYGRYIIALALLIVASVGGWRGYEYYRQQQAEAAGGRLQDALVLASAGKTSEAEASLASLERDAPTGYRLLARFRLAAETAKRDPAAAVKAYDGLAADGSIGSVLQGLAKVRAGYLLVDTAPYADLAARMEPLAGSGEPWRHSAREILGLSAWRAKDLAQASKWFEAIVGDAEVPSPARQRAELMLQLIAADAPPKAAS